MPAGIGYDYDGDGQIDPGSDPLEGLGTGGVADPLLLAKLRSQRGAQMYGGGAAATPPPPGTPPPNPLVQDMAAGGAAIGGMARPPQAGAGGGGMLDDVMAYLSMLFGGGR